jgi:hypothetical protein
MLVDVLPKLEERLRTIRDAAGKKCPAFGTGHTELSLHGAPPRIVWVPTAGPIRPASDQGGDGVTKPRKLWERHIEVAAHLWSDDLASGEELMEHLVGAIHDVGWGSYGMVSENWLETEAGVTTRGELCVVTFNVVLPLGRPLTAAVSAPIELDVSASATMGDA